MSLDFFGYLFGKLKINMNNVIKNFYCDFIILKIKNLSFSEKVIFLSRKYLYLILKISKVKFDKIKLLNYEYISDDDFGLLSAQIMLKDYYKYYFIRNIEKPVIFDVGAHIGNFSIASNVFYKDCKVYSFEPVKSTFDILSFNIANYVNIKVFNIALGKENKRDVMFFSNSEKDRSSFFKDNILNQENLNTQEIEIKTISSIVKEFDILVIDILKIDVEGFEYEVIEGASDILNRVKFVIVENHLKDHPHNFAKISKILTDNNFILYRIGKIWSDENNQISVFDLIYKKL